MLKREMYLSRKREFYKRDLYISTETLYTIFRHVM